MSEWKSLARADGTGGWKELVRASGSGGWKALINDSDALEAYIEFNEASWNGTANEVKDNINKHHGVAVNGLTTIATGKVGRCGEYDGESDYIDIGTNLQGTITEYTAMIWFYLTGSSIGHRYFLFETKTYSPISLGLRFDSSVWKLQAFTHYNDDFVQSFYFNTDGNQLKNTWHHAAVRWKKNDIFRGVLNGSDDGGLNSVDKDLWTTPGFIIGGHRDGTGRNFEGKLDQFRYYKKMLSVAEITAIYDEEV